MGVLEFFRPRKRPRLGVRCTYALTQLGKTKAEEYSVGGPPWQVLAYLDENGASSLSEIADGVHLGEDRVRTIIGKLIRSGYVRRCQIEE